MRALGYLCWEQTKRRSHKEMDIKLISVHALPGLNLTYFVSLTNKMLENISINYGVPQGPVLGPVLFYSSQTSV